MEITVIKDMDEQIHYMENLINNVVVHIHKISHIPEREFHCTIMLNNGTEVRATISIYGSPRLISSVRAACGLSIDSRIEWTNYETFYSNVLDKVAEAKSLFKDEKIPAVPITVAKPNYPSIEKQIENVIVRHSASRNCVTVTLQLIDKTELTAETRYYGRNSSNNEGLISATRRSLLIIKDMLSSKTGRIEYYISAAKLASRIAGTVVNRNAVAPAVNEAQK